MWVCLCKGVTDGVIRGAVDDGARTTFDIALACRAGTGCGGCLPEVQKVVWERLADLGLAQDEVSSLSCAGSAG